MHAEIVVVGSFGGFDPISGGRSQMYADWAYFGAPGALLTGNSPNYVPPEVSRGSPPQEAPGRSYR